MPLNSTPLVSVVTPFYNTAEWLEECIQSVLRQTYNNWEYTLIDNHSTDGSAEIAARYAAQYPGKIRVVQPPTFLNQVQNYNFALSCISAASKYVKMVQADDWIFDDCLRAMVELGEAHPEVAIIAAYELETSWISMDGLKYPASETSGREICRLFFLQNMSLFGSPTSLMMRADVVRQRNPNFYDERHAPFEDAHVCFDILQTANYGFVHQVLTFSRRDNESILLKLRPFRFELFSRLAKIVAHGRKFLNDDEYRYCLQDAQRNYFYFLGLAALEGRSPDFWEFHHTRLAAIGYPAGAGFKAKWISIVLLDHLGNPKRTFEYLWPKRARLFSAASRFAASVMRGFTRPRISAKL